MALLEPRARTDLTTRDGYVMTGIALASALLEDYPVPLLKRGKVSSKDGREHSQTHERRWTDTLPRRFAFRGAVATVSISPNRTWCDLSIDFGGRTFYYNFKSLSKLGGEPSNIGGLQVLNYLLLADIGKVTEEQLARRLLARLEDPEMVDTRTRDYFIIVHDQSTGTSWVRSLGSMPESEIKVNPKNVLQSDFRYAPVYARSQFDVFRLFAAKYADYSERRARPHLILSGSPIDPMTFKSRRG